MLAKRQKMDITRNFQSYAWCKPDWCYPSMSKETNELLRQCADLPPVQLCDDVEELINKSKAFPIPFPIQTVRLEKLKARRSIDKLKKNIVSTYPLIHERVLLLITHFLIYKREYGSSIEKELYKDMSVPQFIDRLLKKRAVNFMGAADSYLLLSGEKGSLMDGLSPKELKNIRSSLLRTSSSDGWESVGTMNQKPPLLLENCLSYDEMKVSAMVYVSGHTECINAGERRNSGVVREDNIETEAVIIGAIGPRFQREFRMDCEDVLVSAEQNVPEQGYGEEVTPTTCLNVLKNTYVRNNASGRHMWRQMWAEFYQVHSYTYEELTGYISVSNTKDAQKKYTDRYVQLSRPHHVFDNEVYYKRLAVIADTVFIEADHRAQLENKMAYVNVIGCGLGVWKISKHQVDVYVLSVLARLRHLLRGPGLTHVADVNFAYITPSDTILAMFSNATGSSKTAEYKTFFENKKHPNGGINVTIKSREPSSKLVGADAGKLLVLTYPWDGNAHPGNEFWLGSLTGSGDPAAACSTQVAELHNAHINPAVTGDNTRVAAPTGIRTLADHCQQLAV
ncbi:uncharacterized protein LOC118279305 isoform X3 [Spodoptera frugiperda]|uniref:Uncharacterized protein LOC118279305 isoform X3 n=1 Tax=Spodoptera frugiperda TaxID=7108 RepID=A0A9R0DWH3_SPOFR|nr:uncharacterized protein LOC118279305 isoform X3 [Spodoptera frugiperda]